MLLVSPQTRQTECTELWFVNAYRRRWRVEDANGSSINSFLWNNFYCVAGVVFVDILCFVGLAFYWLNSWGEESYNKLLESLFNHPSRLPKQVTYLFNALASQIRQLRRPKIKIPLCEYFDSG
jgi:hypothetical protein